MDRVPIKSMLVGLRIVFAVVTAVVLNPYRTSGYEGAEHEDIGDKAKANYVQYVTDHPTQAVGIEPLDTYWALVRVWLVGEDIDYNPLNHFWDPETGNGLPGLTDAHTYALSLWGELRDNYEGGNYNAAYSRLGRVMHLIADMGVPAHVNLDQHLTKIEWYEHTYIPTRRQTSTNIASESVGNLMDTLAHISRAFDSGDVDGNGVNGWVNGHGDNGTRRAGGFTLTPVDEGADIANACYPAAIAASGGMLKLFFDTVKPSVALDKPAMEDLCSGLLGVELRARACSYRRDFGDVTNRIDRVVFEYTMTDPPPFSSFASIGTVPYSQRDAQNVMTYTWNNGINHQKVWVRARTFDNGLCPSLPNSCWIKIDSERPKIQNTKP